MRTCSSSARLPHTATHPESGQWRHCGARAPGGSFARMRQSRPCSLPTHDGLAYSIEQTPVLLLYSSLKDLILSGHGSDICHVCCTDGGGEIECEVLICKLHERTTHHVTRLQTPASGFKIKHARKRDPVSGP